MTQPLMPGPPLSSASLDAAVERLPDDVVALWRDHGLGATADGYLRIVDPTAWQDVLAEVAPRFAAATPLMSSALGDLVVWLDGRAHLLEFRRGTSRIIANRLSTLLVILGYESFLADPDYFDWSPFPEARERLGVCPAPTNASVSARCSPSEADDLLRPSRSSTCASTSS
ncbi:GAD-like domain-containing protein [Frigoribacterium sp. SL97]|nr:GAD-like domain-containing protein [Frigoribacterium sp. SL97]WAC52081.1 GAD-like domain-containing protein [Frigoribacterium sp. SL97]